jgi:hypothetical protein
MRVMISTEADPEVIQKLTTEIDEACTEDLLERILDAYEYPIQGPARSPELQTQIIEHMIESSRHEDGRCVIDIEMGPHEYWSYPDIEALLQASTYAGGTFVALGSTFPGQDALTFGDDFDTVYRKVEMISSGGMPPFTGIARMSSIDSGSELINLVDAVDIEGLNIMEEANEKLREIIYCRNDIRHQRELASQPTQGM